MLTETAVAEKNSTWRYILAGTISQVGSSKLFLAWDTELGRYVAIKRLCKDTQIDANLRKEAGILAGLQHPNVVTLFDLNDDEGGLFAVMEYVNGQMLSEIAANRPMDIRTFIEMGDQICRGLAAAHSRGITHQDIKPANIILCYHEDQSFTAKMLDFGLAKYSSKNAAMPGSVDTIPPELLRGKPADVRSDIYSLGCAFYFALLSRHPYSGTQNESINMRVEKTTPPVHLCRPEIPQHISNLIQKMMALDPASRPQSVDEVRQKLLGNSLREIPLRPRHYNSKIVNRAPAYKTAPTPQPAERAQVAAAKKSTNGFALAVLLITAAAGGAYYYLNHPSINKTTAAPVTPGAARCRG
jgi:serine/threonine protein kinase